MNFKANNFIDKEIVDKKPDKEKIDKLESVFVRLLSKLQRFLKTPHFERVRSILLNIIQRQR